MEAKIPTCLNCGKKLIKKTRSENIPSGTPTPTELGGRPVVQVVSRKPDSLHHGEDKLSLWMGDWGGYADNFFCGLNCGYQWAIMMAERETKSHPRWLEIYREQLALQVAKRKEK